MVFVSSGCYFCWLGRSLDWAKLVYKEAREEAKEQGTEVKLDFLNSIKTSLNVKYLCVWNISKRLNQCFLDMDI